MGLTVTTCRAVYTRSRAFACMRWVVSFHLVVADTVTHTGTMVARVSSSNAMAGLSVAQTQVSLPTCTEPQGPQQRPASHGHALRNA